MLFDLNDKFIYNTTVNTNSIEFENLIFPKKEYYFWIQPICGGGQPGKWSFTESFVTECREKELIPYVEDFEKYIARIKKNCGYR